MWVQVPPSAQIRLAVRRVFCFYLRFFSWFICREDARKIKPVSPLSALPMESGESNSEKALMMGYGCQEASEGWYN